jgi:hypothetical protein
VSLSYLRQNYHVPAYRGRTVWVQRADGSWTWGQITGARDAHVRVRLFGEAHARSYHPTDPALLYSCRPTNTSTVSLP